MIVTLMTNKRYSTISLPEKVSGQYFLKLADSNQNSGELISIEGVQDSWRLKTGRKISLIVGEGEKVKSV